MNDDLRTRRGDYERGSLDDGHARCGPLRAVRRLARRSARDPADRRGPCDEPQHRGDDGRPAARMVLLRGWDARGFIFYTTMTAAKATTSPHIRTQRCCSGGGIAAQIRIEGSVERVSVEESDAYFAGRPRGIA